MDRVEWIGAASDASVNRGAARRTVFRLWPVHIHSGGSSSVTALAIGDRGERLLLGLSNGTLEDYRVGVAPDNSGIRLIPCASISISQKAIKTLTLLEATGQAVALSDGVVVLVQLSPLERRALPGFKGITSLAVQTPAVAKTATQPVCIAVASKINRKMSEVSVMMLAASDSAAAAYGAATSITAQINVLSKLPVQAMKWVGPGHLIVCTALEYLMVDVSSGTVTQLFSLPEVATPPAFIVGLPGSRARAVLMMDQVGLVVDSQGVPCQSALTISEKPLAIATYGLFTVFAGQKELSVFQWASTECVQLIRYGTPDFPAPTENLVAVGGPPGGGIALAGHNKVWLLRPVTIKDQTKALLRRGEARAAIDLAAEASAPWAPIVAAEASFILIHGCRFRDAFAAARRCYPVQLQPREFFALEPDHTAPWPLKPPPQKRWDLAPPLGPLFAIVDHVALPVGLPPAPLMSLARRCFVDYLLWAREQSGVEDAAGVDTLIMHLLTDLGATVESSEFAQRPGCRADVDHLRRRLTAAGNNAALAHLAATCGQSKEALQLWQGIHRQSATGGDSAAVDQAAALAAQNAAAIMADPQAADDEVTLMFLPWLVGAAPARVLTVLKNRALPHQPVLRLLTLGPLDPALEWGDDTCDTLQLPSRRTATADGGSASWADLRWQYLEHLVLDCDVSDSHLHLELAETLIDVVLPLWAVCSSSDSSIPRPLSAAGADSMARLRRLRKHLQSHLNRSQCLDVESLLHRLQGTLLWQEQIILYSKVGRHDKALRILALDIGDVPAAVQYSQKHLGISDGHTQLQHLLLHPDDGSPPRLLDACRLLRTAGSNLDPLDVLECLREEDAPLAAVQQVVMELLAGHTHRARHGTLLRSLRRADSLAAAATRAQLMTRKVEMLAVRSCVSCHTRIGPRLFAVQPDGSLLCFKCYSQANGNSDSTAQPLNVQLPAEQHLA